MYAKVVKWGRNRIEVPVSLPRGVKITQENMSLVFSGNGYKGKIALCKEGCLVRIKARSDSLKVIHQCGRTQEVLRNGQDIPLGRIRLLSMETEGIVRVYTLGQPQAYQKLRVRQINLPVQVAKGMQVLFDTEDNRIVTRTPDDKIVSYLQVWYLNGVQYLRGLGNRYDTLQGFVAHIPGVTPRRANRGGLPLKNIRALIVTRNGPDYVHVLI